MKFKIQKSLYLPKPYWLVANTLALLLFFFVISVSSAWADQYNDAYYSEVGESLSSPAGIETGGPILLGGGGPPAAPGAAQAGSGDMQDWEYAPTASGGAEEDAAGLDTSLHSDAGSTQPGSGIETDEELIALLIAQGTVTSIGSSFDDDEFGISEGGWVAVDGAKMRAAAKNDPDIGKVLDHWRGVGKGAADNVRGRGRLTTGEYYSLVAAELASDDERLERATLEASRFTITYRSRGALFAVIPMSFPVRVEVTAGAAKDMVKVRLPWYRLFIRKYFSASSLAGEVDAVVAKKLAGLPSDATDVQAILFTTVADFLKQKVRTISDTIFLGTS